MSFLASRHLLEIQTKISQLLPGDILFTTTDHYISNAIKSVTGLPISHCNLYTKPMHLIESGGTVMERYIPTFFEEQKFTRVIAFQNPQINGEQRKEIVAAAESFKGKGYDSMQLLAHGIITIGHKVYLPLNIAGRISPDFKLAAKRMQATYASAALDLFNWDNNGIATSGKSRDGMMCSTLIVYSYMKAGIDLKMMLSGYAGLDDIYHYCQKNMKKVFEISF